jgi:ketose-bisphosphate aldolase
MRNILATALAEGYAVGYFEAWDPYSLEAVLEVAEEARSPVILGFGCQVIEQGWLDGGGLRRLAALGRATAEDAEVPVSLLLNEALTFEQVMRGLAWGFNAVMLDTSELPLEENIAAARRVVEAAHALGADVEGELGRLPDASGVLGGPAKAVLTDPKEAARYVAETGVDALSISIGNVHVLTEGQAQIHLDHLARLHQALEIPFAIHGGTGFPDEAVPRAIELGVAKFNVGTVLKQLFLAGVQEALADLPSRVNVHQVVGSHKGSDFLERGKARMKAEVKRRMTVYGSMGKA